MNDVALPNTASDVAEQRTYRYSVVARGNGVPSKLKNHVGIDFSQEPDPNLVRPAMLVIPISVP
jgi:hypothetical protein